VHELAGLREDEPVSNSCSLDLSEFFAELYGEHLVQVATQFNGLLANKLETLVERVQDFVIEEDPCF
jgi:hypothetical protein